MIKVTSKYEAWKVAKGYLEKHVLHGQVGEYSI